MAAAEARAAWQRTANRCFVQEDAKRAPKLACSQSSSCSKILNGSSVDPVNGSNNPSTFMPLNWDPTNSNLPPDTKWWLQLQPSFAHHKDFKSELSSLSELEGLRTVDSLPISKHVEGSLSSEDIHGNQDKSNGSFMETQRKMTFNCMKHDSEARVLELKAGNIDKKPLPQQKRGLNERIGNQKGFMCGELMDWENIGLISNHCKTFCMGLESSWIWDDKAYPWWRITDENELASLVAEKSLCHIENCDLPRPQTRHFDRNQSTLFVHFDRTAVFDSPVDQNVNSGLCTPVELAQCIPPSMSMVETHCQMSEMPHSYFDSEKPFSSSDSQCSNTTIIDPTECKHASGTDQSKVQLLKALCHSQTRAREAEKAAQKAYSEREHVIKLLFKQASHLFAYRQWLQILQLESILLQLKNNDHPISILFPVLPWTTLKASQMRKAVHRVKRKICKRKGEIGKYAFAFAVGLSLVGAGLMLGWSLGWFLSSL